MDILVALLAAVVGYLIGSISFARLMVRVLAPGANVSTIEHAVPGSNTVFQSGSVSATAVRFQLGTRYGCLAAILDMLKALFPTLAFRLWQPDVPYYLITATMVTVGHNYPIFYGFKGGRGLATIYGGFLVLDWMGILVTSISGMLFGGLLGQVLIMRWAGLLLMIPWIWLRTHDVAKLAYVLIANGLFWYAMLPELKQFFRLRREGQLPDEQEVAEFMGMGSVYRVVQRFSLVNLFKKKGQGPKQEDKS
jgi:glycerol-3-phosphate acyltransferase PlsY